MDKPSYLNDAENVGDWSDPEQAAGYWNTYIRPILEDALVEGDDSGAWVEPTVVTETGLIVPAADWVWGEFCRVDAGEDEKVCINLANELHGKLA